LATYAWLGFMITLLVEPNDPVRWVGNIVFAGVALALVLVARVRQHWQRSRADRRSDTWAT
jgi:hypothetical protein